MARKRNPACQALWRQRVGRQQSSGLTIAQFCAQERCAKSSFYNWRRHFKLANPPDRRSTQLSPSSFLPVAVRLVGRDGDQPAPIEADLPNGIRLRIPTANAPLAYRLVRVVAAAKTSSGASR